MFASLVYATGDDSVILPASYDKPNHDQMQGTIAEQLIELAGRTCYDSFGTDENSKPKGRSSAKFHAHLKEVKHFSVYEHVNFTINAGYWDDCYVAACCVNRKGVYYSNCNEVTVNLRAAIEWDQNTTEDNFDSELSISTRIKDAVFYYASQFAPQIFGSPSMYFTSDFPEYTLKTDNLTDNQAFISMYMYGSRGFSHEQVRHRFSMSQRSTRYVDEDGSLYIQHPLVTKFLNDPSAVDEITASHGYLATATYMETRRYINENIIKTSVDADRLTYQKLVKSLEKYGLDNGLDKQTARKQARGAARNYLGNGLATEMIFTAPISGWKIMLRQRLHPAADAEIRTIYGYVLDELKKSRYGDRFNDFQTKESPDGLGVVLA